MKPLVMPPPLDSRRFHTREVVAAYNQQVSDYLLQQTEAEHSHSKTSKRKHPSRKEQFNDQY